MGYKIYSAEQFHLVNTTPALNEVSTSENSISLNFNKTLSTNNLVATSTPTNISSESVIGKKLVINFTAIDNKPYIINILTIFDTRGAEINNLKLRFTPTYVPFNKLPASAQKNIINEQPNQNQPTSALDLLPYNGSDYELMLLYNTSNPTATPNIEFTYVPNTMDNLEGAPAEQAAINSAKAWLTSNNISLSTYSLIDSSTGQPL